MAYKDKDKQRDTVKLATRRYRLRLHNPGDTVLLQAVTVQDGAGQAKKGIEGAKNG